MFGQNWGNQKEGFSLNSMKDGEKGGSSCEMLRSSGFQTNLERALEDRETEGSIFSVKYCGESSTGGSRDNSSVISEKETPHGKATGFKALLIWSSPKLPD